MVGAIGETEPREVTVEVEHIGITVSDMARAISLFVDTLGGTVAELGTFAGPPVETSTGVPGAKIKVAFARLGAHEFELVQYLEPRDAAIDAGPSRAGHMHIAVRTGRFDDMVARLKAAGFAARSPIPGTGERPQGGLYFFGFDNLVIELKATDQTSAP